VIEDHALQLLVAAGALGAKVREVSVPPDDAARQEHRPAGPVAFLEDERLGTQLASARGRAKAGHPRAGYD
jgi:hypothetical protein